ncbi:hypothetical protein PDJAM_G00125880 [Pangasius djambal]|uniref:Uncharacterized protein n=1 Tax=Pangasius djambal TaxID=1691987 RepID=A0ACC5ZAE8_9TELE|nr:hypothetical protein [Pangasius djambal]
MEFNEETHSLTLKNLQKSDSGLYEAEASDEKKEIVATYQLYVLDPVEKPVLYVSPQRSNDACNVTLTCGAQKLSITSHCYNDNCDNKEEKTAGDVFLSLKVFGSYKDRVEFNEETHSLTLKNLQKSDSGLYEAESIDAKKEIVATYQLYVLDPVEKPVLNVTPQRSNDACNVTLTCGAQKLSITSRCYNDNCDNKEEKTAGDAFLSLYKKIISILGQIGLSQH